MNGGELMRSETFDVVFSLAIDYGCRPRGVIGSGLTQSNIRCHGVGFKVLYAMRGNNTDAKQGQDRLALRATQVNDHMP
jgi:hypothetical protein